MPPVSIHFNPSPADTTCVLSDIASAHRSLEDIANNYDIAVEALLVWLARPDIQERLSTNTTTTAARARFVAAAHLPQAVSALVTMMEAYASSECNDAYPDNMQASALRETQRQNARRAGALLLRIARYYAPTSPSLSPRESRRLCGGEGFASSPSSIAQEPAAPAHTAVDHLPDAALSALLSPRAITLAGSSRQSDAPCALINSASNANPSLSRSSGRVAVLGGEGFASCSPSISSSESSPAPIPSPAPHASPAPTIPLRPCGGGGRDLEAGGGPSKSPAPTAPLTSSDSPPDDRTLRVSRAASLAGPAP